MGKVRVVKAGQGITYLRSLSIGQPYFFNAQKRVFDSLLEDYAALDQSADVVVRQLRKISNPDSRRKVIKEFRNLENRRLELLDQMDGLSKST
jgi:hypothetical protein